MHDEVDQAIAQLDTRISENKILSRLLQDFSSHDIDIERYVELGYDREDIAIGMEVVKLYLGLKEQYKRIT